MRNNIVSNIMKKRKLSQSDFSDEAIRNLKKPPKKINWKAKTWRRFSIYIRVRDVVTESGHCKCISCGKFVHWKNCDAGHFINRQFTTIIYNEMNVNAQCLKCNRFEEGAQVKYRASLVEKYGENKVLMLEAAKGKKRWYDFDLEALYIVATQDIKRIKKEKGLE